MSHVYVYDFMYVHKIQDYNEKTCICLSETALTFLIWYVPNKHTTVLYSCKTFVVVSIRFLSPLLLSYVTVLPKLCCTHCYPWMQGLQVSAGVLQLSHKQDLLLRFVWYFLLLLLFLFWETSYWLHGVKTSWDSHQQCVRVPFYSTSSPAFVTFLITAILAAMK